jgi:hypothetical protein
LTSDNEDEDEISVVSESTTTSPSHSPSPNSPHIGIGKHGFGKKRRRIEQPKHPLPSQLLHFPDDPLS